MRSLRKELFYAGGSSTSFSCSLLGTQKNPHNVSTTLNKPYTSRLVHPGRIVAGLRVETQAAYFSFQYVPL